MACLLQLVQRRWGRHLVWDVIGDCLVRSGQYGWWRVRGIDWDEGTKLVYMRWEGSKSSEWFCHSIEREGKSG